MKFSMPITLCAALFLPLSASASRVRGLVHAVGDKGRDEELFVPGVGVAHPPKAERIGPPSTLPGLRVSPEAPQMMSPWFRDEYDGATTAAIASATAGYGSRNKWLQRPLRGLQRLVRPTMQASDKNGDGYYGGYGYYDDGGYSVPRRAKARGASAAGPQMYLDDSTSVDTESDLPVAKSEEETPPAVSTSTTHASRGEVMLVLSQVQSAFVRLLQGLKTSESASAVFKPVSWLRDGGIHGGGARYETSNGDAVFNRATINLSGVHYDDMPDARVTSASAISVILHPHNPYAPSMHFHMSYIEPSTGTPYWRMIADLNPSIEDSEGKAQFESALRTVVPDALYRDGKAFGDKYFDIPALGRTRGVSHMFIPKLESGAEMSPTESVELAQRLAMEAIGVYCDLVQAALSTHPTESIEPSVQEKQLAYHTLYLFQVLMLDQGTTTGLLAHSDNDVGTLGSLPVRVDSGLLKSWKSKVEPPQDILLQRIIDVLPGSGKGVSEIDTETRRALANVVRAYYKEDMQRVHNQASMDMKWWASLTEKRLAAAKPSA